MLAKTHKTIQAIILCSLLIIPKPLNPMPTLELPNTYTTIACLVSCCIGAIMYRVLHDYCTHRASALSPQQTYNESLEEQKKILIKLDEQQKTIELLAMQCTTLQQCTYAIAYQTHIATTKNSQLLHSINTYISNNINTVPTFIACYWRERYTKKTQELEKYIQQSNNTELRLIANKHTIK